jgi:sterol desaturase/sphingolipid hydroxylase (fatty acid hydroxylase superfamily)
VRSIAAAVANVAVSAGAVLASVVAAPALLVGLAVAGLVGGSLEILVPAVRRRRGLRHWATDLTHAVGNRSLILPIVGLLTAAAGPLVHALTPESVRDGFHQAPWGVRALTLLVLTDFVNYWAHRAMHRVPALWRLHRVHHSTEQLDWLATARGHPLDLALSLTLIAVPSYALDATTEGTALITFLFLYPFLLHANARLPLPLVDCVLVTPSFHHWHHAADEIAHGRNLGSVLTVWDRLFGTALAMPHLPARYGTDDELLADGNYLSHLVAPWRRAPHRGEPHDAR